MTHILGFNDPYHDASFCVLGPTGCAHYELERFTRLKLERLSPLIGFLDLMGDRLHSILPDCAAIGVVEGDFLAPLLRRLIFARSAGPMVDAGGIADTLLAGLSAVTAAAVPEFAANQTKLPSLEPYRDRLRAFVAQALRPEIIVTVLGHHLCHAANAFFSSPHAAALSVTLDGGGFDFLDGDGAGPRALVYGGAFRCEGAAVEPLSWVQDLSIGSAWSRIAQGVLDLKFGEEGTVMAMAAYGDPARFAADLEPPFVWSPIGAFKLARPLAGQIRRLRSLLRTEQDRFDLASSLQQQSEFKVHAFLAPLLGPEVRALCLSGGVFLNCQIAGKIQKWFPWLESVFVPPAPYDGGLSIGAAQYLNYTVRRAPRGELGQATFATGPGYATLDILGACRSRGVAVRAAAPAEVAALLDAGGIGAVFAGPAESGRRALGHRSILADPRTPLSRERINADIKRRAPFRPLAPMVLTEHVADWFDCPPGFASPYMSHALPVRAHVADRIPAVLHRDGTARVQTVHASLTPGLHALLTAWHELSGVPVLLNTSFNENEPIVQTPDQALECYLRTKLDFLYFGDPGLLAEKAPTR